MKFKIFSLSLLSVSSLLTLAPFTTPSASAQCAMVDVATQIAIRGSKDPSKQTNNVNMQDGGACFGNTTTNTSTQLYMGPGSVEQTRESNHYVGGSPNDNPGISSGPAIRVPVHVPVDVYNPAYDPDFMGGLQPGGNVSR